MQPEPSGFDTAFAPLPGQPAAQAETVERPAEPPMFPPSAQPTTTIQRSIQSGPPPKGPTANVRVMHQVGAYPPGSIVPASCFADIQRLLGLGAIEYTYEEINATGPDQSMVVAMGAAQPVQPSSQGMPRAPWSQATVRDILGPALPRDFTRQAPGHTAVKDEHGNTMIVADRP
jgi:hypothetical protein